MKILITVVVILTESMLSDSRLISVHIVNRHCTRAPLGFYPTYPYINETSKVFPRGLGQLTELGIKQCVNIGQYYRQRYGDFYPKDSRNAILQSSNVDRCLDSLAIISNQLWSATSDSDWIAPRIYSAPTQIDTVAYFGPNCPNAELAFYSYLYGPEVAQFNLENRWLYNTILRHTGLDDEGLNGMFNTIGVFEASKLTKDSGFAVPKWLDLYYTQLANVRTTFNSYYFKPENGIRLRVGSLFREIRTRMDQALNSNITVDQWFKNFFLYTTHDYNIVGLTTALGNPQPIYPPYGAAVIFELHEIQNQNIVRVYYLNHTESLPISGVPLIIPSCGVFDCPYQTFISSITQFFPDIKAECGFEDTLDPFIILQQNLTNSIH